MQSKEEVTTHLVERLDWRFARRDESRRARRLWKKQAVDAIYSLEDGAILDACVHFLDEGGVLARWQALQGEGIQRELPGSMARGRHMKTPVPFFVSYAHADQRTADDFLQRLRGQLAPSRRYDYTLWRDTMIAVGQRWHDEIQQALVTCKIGLFLVSPAFLISEYIVQHELPYFLGDAAKPVIPVMLQAIDFQRHDLQGLEHYQFFTLANAKAFAHCPTPALRSRFASTLFVQTEQRLDRLFAHACKEALWLSVKHSPQRLSDSNSPG